MADLRPAINTDRTQVQRENTLPPIGRQPAINTGQAQAPPGNTLPQVGMIFDAQGLAPGPLTGQAQAQTGNAAPLGRPIQPQAQPDPAVQAVGAYPVAQAVGGANPIGEAIFQAPVRHRTFASLFADPTADSNHQGAFQIVARFDPLHATPLTATALKQSLLGLTNPHTYLCCTTLHEATPKIYLLHSLSRYPSSLTGRNTPWDDKILGYLGDVLGDSALTIMLPEEIFDETPDTLVLDAEALVQELPALAIDALLPRVRANAANAVQRRTRYLTYLPTRFAPLLLDNKGYSPKRVWDILIQKFQEEGCIELMGPLLNWVRVTLHATGQNDTGAPATHVNLTAPFADHDLINHRLPFKQVLSGLQGPTPGLETAIAQFATAVNAQVAEAQTARVLKELERDQPTLPSVKFDMLQSSLLNYLNVNSEQDLPELWFRLAAAKKKQEFGTVRDSLEAYARGPTAFCTLAPIATPKLLSDLTSVTFLGDHPDDLKTGIQPFIAMDGSEEHRAAAQELARSYTMLSERDVGITYSDLEKFKVPKELRSHPTNYFELEQSLGLFGNLLGAVLGDNHPLTKNYRTFWTSYSLGFKSRIHFEIDTRRVIKPVHLLRNIQLITYNWFSIKKLRHMPADPPFQDILDRISLGFYSNPTLPAPLYQLINPRPPQGTRQLLGGPASIVSDDASTVSALTGATGLTGAARTVTSSRHGDPVKNPSPDPTLQALLPQTVRVKELIGGDEVPKNEANGPMCLSYHLRGLCFTNCRRKADHERPLTTTDKAVLSNWVVDTLAKRRASGVLPP